MVKKKVKNKKFFDLKNLSNVIPKMDLDSIKIPTISLEGTKQKINKIYDNYKKVKQKEKIRAEKNRKLEKKRELENQKKQAQKDRADKLKEEKRQIKLVQL